MSTNKTQLRDPEDIKKRVTGDIRKLNKRLLNVSIELDKEVRRHRLARTLPGRILTSFYRKATNSFRAIEILKANRLIEEAWILLRVLLETHVNFLYFIRNDPKEMCQRYSDAAILAKLKHLKQVNFYDGIPGMPPREEWESVEQKISSRYSKKELNQIRRNGFTGLTFEQRSSKFGLIKMYEMCYRIASRSVHMFDPAESSMYSHYAYGGRIDRNKFLKARRVQLETNQNMLLGRISYIIAEMIDSHRILDVMLIGLGYEKHCDKTGYGVYESPTERKMEADPPGSFRIWRE